MQNKKLLVFQIISYILFTGIFVSVLYFAINTALKYRKIKHYNERIFSRYVDEDYDSFLEKSVSAFNCFYKKNPIFEYVKKDAIEPFNISFNIYATKTKTRDIKGYVIHVKDLSYSNNTGPNERVDLMHPKRKNPARSSYKPEYEINIGFEYSDKDFNKEKNTDGISFQRLDPMEPIFLGDRYLKSQNGSLKKYPNNYVSKIFFKLSAGKDKSGDYPARIVLEISGDTFDKNNNIFNLKDENYNIDISYNQAKTLPDEYNTYKLNFKGLNGGVIATSIITIILLSVLTYFVFLHKMFKNFLKEKKQTERKHKIENQLKDENTQHIKQDLQ